MTCTRDLGSMGPPDTPSVGFAALPARRSSPYVNGTERSPNGSLGKRIYSETESRINRSPTPSIPSMAAAGTERPRPEARPHALTRMLDGA
jgi:hypothetical protein